MSAVVIIGDVHGNARALRGALAAARAAPPDEIVFIGDLLTYGHDVDEVIDLVAEEQRRGATVLVGNHDQMYFDLAAGDRSYLERLPPWLQATVEHTLERLPDDLRDRLVWSTEHVRNDVLFAHANPFAAGDWTYLNSGDDVARASTVLDARGYRAGVFGHTHRARWHRDDPPRGTSLAWNEPHALVLNVGSVGQPRDGTGRSLIVRLDTEQLRATFEPIDYDVAGHVQTLRASGLPSPVIDRLVAFFASS